MEPAAADAAGANDANGGVPYPCCRIETTDGLWAGEAVEKAAYHMCCAYGAVIDARCAEDGAVLVYFAAEGTAVEAARRLVGRELGEFYIEDTSTNVANVEVTISGLGAGEKGAQLEADVAGECGKYGRVLDVFCDGSVVRVAFASVSGAAAAVIALDGAALDGARVAAALGTDMAMEPSAVLRNVATEEFTAADLHVECAQFGRVKAVRAILAEGDCFTVAFDEARAAAACAAALDGRKYAGKAVAATFRVRGAEDEFDAAFGAAVVGSLGPATAVAAAAVEDAAATAAAAAAAMAASKLHEQLEKAVIALRLAVARAPDDETIRSHLAGALLRLGGPHNVQQAVNHARHAISVKPLWSWGHVRVGAALLQQGDVAAAAASLALAVHLDPTNEAAVALAARAKAEVERTLDPLDAFCAVEVDSAFQRDLAEAQATAKRERESGAFAKSKRLKTGVIDSDDDEFEMTISSRAHCYICKQYGHSKKDCPLAKCQYCHAIGHQKKDCTLFSEAITAATEEEKKARRKQGYEKKKLKKKEEWTAQLRDQAGVDGFEALYRVLGLPERRLATAAEIKKAYHRRSLMFHPDKHPNDRDEAHDRFLEIKAAYELLIEGMQSGGKGFKGGAVFSAGELTDAAAAQALQEKVNSLADKVKKNSAWAG